MDRLAKANIEYRLKEKANTRELQQMYNAIDLYLVTSRVEGGPYAVLEAPAMKVPILSNDVGMAKDTLVESSIVDFKNFNKNPQDIEVDVEENYKKVQKFSFINIKEKFVNVFERVLNENIS